MCVQIHFYVVVFRDKKNSKEISKESRVNFCTPECETSMSDTMPNNGRWHWANQNLYFFFFFFWLKEAGSNSDRKKFNLVWKHISYASLNFDRCNRPDILTWDQHCLHFFLNILKFCNAVNNIHIMTYILNCN